MDKSAFIPRGIGAPLFKRPSGLRVTPDLTPLVDVVFQLLLFFMLSSSFVAPALRLDLPEASAEPRQDQESPVIVSVDADGLIFVNREQVTMQTLTSTISQVLDTIPSDQRAVRFRGDRSIDYGQFVEIMDRVHDLGVQTFQVEHQPSDTKP